MAAGLYLCFSVALSLSLLSASVSSDVSVGAPEDINPNLPEVKKAASFAVNAYNKESKDEYLYKVLKIISAQAQVVAGINYILVVEIGRTQCKKGATNSAESCALIQSSNLAKKFLCRFEVYEVPWLNKETLVEHSCKAQVRML
ncbi:cystatin-like [Ascaphus truei]|uniref:cystatin-like n=1 Tax=Ascaphus truei TaxID=8439 RepID=UPI003F59CEBB